MLDSSGATCRHQTAEPVRHQLSTIPSSNTVSSGTPCIRCKTNAMISVMVQQSSPPAALPTSRIILPRNTLAATDRFVNANNCNEPTDYVVDDRGVDDVGSSMAGVATAGSCHQTTRSWHGMQAAPETKLSLRYVASEPHSVGKRNLVVTQAQVLIYMGTNFITCFVVHF
jgi:hypothetical protein